MVGSHIADVTRLRASAEVATLRPVTSGTLVGSTLDGRYQVDGVIGEGGMGVVYDAVQLAFDRRVAIKAIHTDTNASELARQRFRLEARAVSRLEHDHVVRVYDFGTTREGAAFLVMERLTGQTLRQRFVSGGITFEQTLTLMGQVAAGVGAAHAQGLIHRDLKPENLFLADGADDQPCAKVLDFGLVTGTELLPADRDLAVGTPGYMSPEQAGGAISITAASDVYSLGVVLYELIVGERPFRGDVAAVVYQHFERAVPRPARTLRGLTIPPEVSALWVRAMAKRPTDRFVDASAFRVALHEARERVIGRDDANISTLGLPQRRLATMLVVQLALEELDPEAQFLVLSGVSDAADEKVRDAGGRMFAAPEGELHIAFGLPVAREDDAARAVRCARELRQLASDQGIDANVGIHTGTVMTSGGQKLRLAGEPFHLPKMIGTATRSRGPLMSGSTRRALRWQAALRPLREVAGETVYLVPERDAAAAHDSPLAAPTAREAELATLLSRTRKSLETNQCLALEVTAAPGMGKSRLWANVAGSLRARHPSARVLQVRCRGRAVPHGLARQLAEAIGEEDLIASADDAAAGRRAAAARPQATVAATPRRLPAVSQAHDDTMAADGRHRLAGLFDSRGTVADADSDWESRAQRAMAASFRALAARGGVVVVVDDYHAVDTASDELLRTLIQRLDGFPFIVLAFARHAGGLGEAIALEPLSDAVSRELAAIMMGMPADSPRVERLVRRAEGNPLFLEELGRMAMEVGDEALPESLHAMLRARLDALPVREQDALRRASVVGVDFDAAAVEAQHGLAGVNGALDALVERGTLTREPGGTLAFVSPLLREVAYETLLFSDRRKRHLAVADALELSERTPNWEHVAAHFELAELPLRAADAWRRAARHALDRFAKPEAARALEKALVLGNWDVAVSTDLSADLGITRYYLGNMDEARSLLREVAELSDSPEVQARALRYLARIADRTGNAIEQRDCLERAQLLSGSLSSAEAVHLAAERALAALRRGENDVARELLESIVVTGGALPSALTKAWASVSLALSIHKRKVGDLEGARDAAYSAVSAFESLNYAGGVATSLLTLSIVYRSLERSVEALDTARRSVALADESGLVGMSVRARVNFGWALTEAGHHIAARQVFGQARARASQTTPTDEALLAAGAGMAADGLNHPDGKALVDDGLKIARELGFAEVIGWAAMAAGTVHRSADLLIEAREIWEQLSRPVWVVKTDRLLDELDDLD